jgi:hypothetical protein
MHQIGFMQGCFCAHGGRQIQAFRGVTERVNSPRQCLSIPNPYWYQLSGGATF